MDVAPVRESLGEDIVGWVAACILVALLLPMLGMLYLDVLEAKHDAKVQMEKVEKLRREIERDRRDKKPDTFADSPVLGGMRRPLEIPLPKSNKLE